jgi:hypothetical protein
MRAVLGWTLLIVLGLWGVACATPGGARIDGWRGGWAPMAIAATLPAAHRPSDAAGYVLLAVPVKATRRAVAAASGSTDLTDANWSWTVKQKGRVQAYVVQTPDFYEVVEQELPRHQQTFNSLPEALAFANQHYASWPLVSLEQ